MTDKEERQHVIEVLKQMRLDYEDFWEENDTEEIKALNYAIASIETDLKYDLLYEETSGQADKPTTKNNLVVDAISRQAINGYIDYILSHGMGKRKSFEFIKKFVANLPPVTPQEPKTGHWIEEFNDLEGEVRFTCSSCGEYQLFGTEFCYHCGSDNREVEE